MRNFPLLILPYFTHPFVLECDTFSEGIGEVLMQNQHLIAFESRKLIELDNLYPIYDKNMLAIMHALDKFKQYLVGGCFVVRTNHNNLRYFLE